MKKHRHYDIIEEWARTGKQIQFRRSAAIEFADCCGDPKWNEGCEYRFKKPQKEKICYRCYITHNEGTYGVDAYYAGSTGLTLEEVEKLTFFVKWIDTDWVEYEI